MVNGLVVLAVIVVTIGAVFAVARLLGIAGGKRPETSSAEREQIIAQNRVFSGRPAHNGDTAWDGHRRGPIPTEPGSSN